MYVIGSDTRLMPKGRGLLCLHGNVGLTVDLSAVRKTHRGYYPAKFVAIAGMGDARSVDPQADGMVDFWVFVDGRLALKRMGVRPADGPFAVDVELGPESRFLTLAVTDGGNTHAADWAVFGAPVLQMSASEAENK